MGLIVADVWRVLVEECGARADGIDDFTRHWPWCREYRFVGALGFGGKVWASRYSDGDYSPRVTCYSEDETPERLAMIARANERLAAL